MYVRIKYKNASKCTFVMVILRKSDYKKKKNDKDERRTLDSRENKKLTLDKP